MNSIKNFQSEIINIFKSINENDNKKTLEEKGKRIAGLVANMIESRPNHLQVRIPEEKSNIFFDRIVDDCKEMAIRDGIGNVGTEIEMVSSFAKKTLLNWTSKTVQKEEKRRP